MSHSPPVLLASGSAYRRALLNRVLASFECLAPDVDETRGPQESAQDSALRLSILKASTCAATHTGAIIIGSDQVPSLDGDTFGKPGSFDRAVEQLRRCSGQAVVFNTAVSVMGPDGKAVESHIDKTTVRFRSLSDDEIEAYLRREEPYDCAGSFKAEALGIALFESIETTDPTAIQGLPLIWLCDCLRRRGVTLF